MAKRDVFRDENKYFNPFDSRGYVKNKTSTKTQEF
jgi:hypothetical protein